MLKLNQILFNILIKDPETKGVRPPTLLGCVIDMEDTKKRSGHQKALVYLEKHVLNPTKLNSTLCKLTCFGKVYSDFLLSIGSYLRAKKAERGLAIITDDSYQCGPVIKKAIPGSIKTDKS